jgi:hypothetical protein
VSAEKGKMHLPEPRAGSGPESNKATFSTKCVVEWGLLASRWCTNKVNILGTIVIYRCGTRTTSVGHARFSPSTHMSWLVLYRNGHYYLHRYDLLLI